MLRVIDTFIESYWIKIFPVAAILILILVKNLDGVYGKYFGLVLILIFATFCLYYGGLYWGVIQVAVFLAVSVFFKSIHEKISDK